MSEWYNGYLAAAIWDRPASENPWLEALAPLHHDAWSQGHLCARVDAQERRMLGRLRRQDCRFDAQVAR